jgi:hypothetical protein
MPEIGEHIFQEHGHHAFVFDNEHLATGHLAGHNASVMNAP